MIYGLTQSVHLTQQPVSIHPFGLQATRLTHAIRSSTIASEKQKTIVTLKGFNMSTHVPLVLPSINRSSAPKLPSATHEALPGGGLASNTFRRITVGPGAFEAQNETPEDYCTSNGAREQNSLPLSLPQLPEDSIGAERKLVETAESGLHQEDDTNTLQSTDSTSANINNFAHLVVSFCC